MCLWYPLLYIFDCYFSASYHTVYRTRVILMLNGVIYLKQSCFFSFLREQKAKSAVLINIYLGSVAVDFGGINLKSFFGTV